jgi:tripartite-type tricarboxylate transporter receptor subunit TctC
LPQIPHAVEAGLPELQMNNWYGLMMPAGVSVKVKSDMELALLKAFRAPEIAYRLTDLGLSAPGDAATFKNKLNSEFEKWIPVIRKAGIRSE